MEPPQNSSQDSPGNQTQRSTEHIMRNTPRMSQSREPSAHKLSSILGYASAILLQIALIVIFWGCATYKDQADYSPAQQIRELQRHLQDTAGYTHLSHLAVFVVFGFVFSSGLSKNDSEHEAGSIEIFVASMGFEWGVVICEFWTRMSEQAWESREALSFDHLFLGLFTALSALISFAPVRRGLSCGRALLLTALQVFMYGVNFYVGHFIIGVSLWQRHLWVHLYAAMFASGVLFFRVQPIEEAAANRTRDSMTKYLDEWKEIVGLGFLYVMFPSYNVINHSTANHTQVVVNTFIGLATASMISMTVPAPDSTEQEEAEDEREPNPAADGEVDEPGNKAATTFDVDRVRRYVISAGVALASSVSCTKGPATSATVSLISCLVVDISSHMYVYLGESLYLIIPHLSGAIVGSIASIIIHAESSDFNYYVEASSPLDVEPAKGISFSFVSTSMIAFASGSIVSIYMDADYYREIWAAFIKRIKPPNESEENEPRTPFPSFGFLSPSNTNLRGSSIGSARDPATGASVYTHPTPALTQLSPPADFSAEQQPKLTRRKQQQQQQQQQQRRHSHDEGSEWTHPSTHEESVDYSEASQTRPQPQPQPHTTVTSRKAVSSTRKQLAAMDSEQIAAWLASIGLENASRVAREHGVVGSDIIDSRYENLRAFFGIQDASDIWFTIGAMYY